MKTSIRIALGLILVLASVTASAVPTRKVYLSGTGSDDTVLWDFYCTAGRGSGRWTKIPVPSNWEFQGFGQFTYGHMPLAERLDETGIYRHRFPVPAAWRGQEVTLVFGGSMTDTSVKLNGRPVGELHQGGYCEFRIDVTDALRYGRNNVLEVNVCKSSADKSVVDAERQADFWVFGGIFRPVWLEVRPALNIRRVAIDARADGSFAMDAFVGGSADGAEVRARVRTLDGQPFGPAFSAPVGPDGVAHLRTAFADPLLWSDEFPNRYRVDAELVRSGTSVHEVSEKFGFRTAEIRPGDGFYINGEKVKFRGVDRHSFHPRTGRALNFRQNLQDAELIKEMNMNAVRMSHYPPDRAFLDICDSLGLYIIDELTGWASFYGEEVGHKLARELVVRDVNHPCVVLWANGNEGGYNFNLLPDYAALDIQQRRVIHPRLEERDVHTHHYLSWGEAVNFMFQGRKVFFPTEFLHGLYDGGHGAGLDDYWTLMWNNPLSAGGFLWDLVDQAVYRDDLGGTYDTDGNHGADGILGPYREKEGSFYAIKDIWSPVQMPGTPFLPLSFDGRIKVENRYAFTNLSQCRFTATLSRLDFRSGQRQDVSWDVPSPDVEPGLTGYLRVRMPEDFRDYDLFTVRAVDPHGRELSTWTRTITQAAAYAARIVPDAQPAGSEAYERVKAADLFYAAAARRSGVDQRELPARHPAAASRRSGIFEGGLPAGLRFTSGGLVQAGTTEDEDGYVRTGFRTPQGRDNGLNFIRVGYLPSGWVDVEYSFAVSGRFDHVGVTFDFPEEGVRKVRWLGRGPYRVWKNRTRGVQFGLWEKDYNDTATGEGWEYPEFKGFHSDVYAAELDTDGGTLSIVMASEDLYLRLFTPAAQEHRNNDNTLGVFPDGDISVLNAISPVGTKFKRAADLGPASQQNSVVVSRNITDPVTGHFYLKFTAR